MSIAIILESEMGTRPIENVFSPYRAKQINLSMNLVFLILNSRPIYVLGSVGFKTIVTLC